jgi:hypothetical protein
MPMNATSRCAAGCVLSLVIVVVAADLGAQQPAGRQGGQGGQGRQGGARGGGAFAPPAIPWEAPPLPDGPITVQSAVPAHRNLRLTVTKGLSHPCSLDFLTDVNMIVIFISFGL